MSIARNLASLFSASTSAATDSEVTAAIATHNTSANGHIKRGGTSSRPNSPSIGDIYYNTDLKDLEQYTEDGWLIVAKQPPRIPTIGTPTLSADNTASVPFTPSSYGQSASSYTIQSNPGSFTATGSSSPLTIAGSNLDFATSYTFRVKATGSYGDSAYSAYSSSVTTDTLSSFEPIQTITSTGSNSTFEFTSIPQTYQHLQVRMIHRCSSTNTAAFNFLYLNGLYGSPFTQWSYHRMWGDGTSIGSNAAASTARVEWWAPSEPNANNSAGLFAISIIDILDYTNTNKNKTVKLFSGFDRNGSGSVGVLSGLLHSTQNAINRINIDSAYGAYASGSQAALYGIKGL